MFGFALLGFETANLCFLIKHSVALMFTLLVVIALDSCYRALTWDSVLRLIYIIPSLILAPSLSL